LFILTTIPGKALPKIAVSDKVKHILGYMILGFLLDFALYLQNKYPLLSKYTYFFTFLVGIMYGLFDELHQILIPGRYFEWWDLFADGIGMFLGIILSQIIIKGALKNNFFTEKT
jgi:VanZ family protein